MKEIWKTLYTFYFLAEKRKYLSNLEGKENQHLRLGHRDKIKAVGGGGKTARFSAIFDFELKYLTK